MLNEEGGCRRKGEKNVEEEIKKRKISKGRKGEMCLQVERRMKKESAREISKREESEKKSKKIMFVG